ncbi:CHC2 zinc finger domain-containing protein [Streptomyces sp. WZ-12]|uniref:CHC2 zinc finger domain-containing protein n=1 Tax=Streptomyces sp. WZ-12 TaxID=3030210 RepID=UPI00406CF945
MSKPDITRVIAHYYGTDISPRHRWTKILCLEHDETNPSASVNTEDQRWTCFACGISEDSFDMIMRMEGVGFTDARNIAEERFGCRSADVRAGVQGKSRRGVHGKARTGPSRRTFRNRLCE